MGDFILLFIRVSHQQNTNETIDENHSTKHYFIFAISNALITFNSKAHQELVPVHIWFHLDKTHFISLLINLVPHHLNWWHSILFNMHETTIKPPFRIILPFRHFLFLGATHVWSLLWNARQTNTFSLSGIFFPPRVSWLLGVLQRCPVCLPHPILGELWGKSNPTVPL